MGYTKDAIRADLKTLGGAKWNWAGDNPDQVRPDVQARMTAAGSSAGAGSLDEIVEYCWTAYDKAVNTQGDQVVGRVPHLNAAGLYGKVSSILEGGTNFDADATANLLKMDKWSLAVNDSWVLGGIHRNAKFRLVSPRLMENLWNQNGFYVVTAREILGLLNFGYKLEQIGPWQVFICKNLELASAADLVKYDRLIRSNQTVEGAQSLSDAEGSEARAQKQVTEFRDRGFTSETQH